MNVDVFKIKKYDSRIKYYFRNLKKKKNKTKHEKSLFKYFKKGLALI